MRRTRDRLFWALCALAFLIIAGPCIWMVVSIFKQAWPQLGLHLLTQRTQGIGGGLRNAIEGTFVLLLGVLIVAGVVGVAAGIYVAEFAPRRLGRILRFFSEVLAGMPSIVIGYVGYLALVVGFHWKYSVVAGVLALSVLVVPYIVKTTEVSLRQVPTALREGAAGLGLPRGLTTWRILLPPAIPGIMSGLIIALAISTGETAPLLFTANFSDQSPTFALRNSPIGYLTYVTYNNFGVPGGAPMAAAAGAVTLVILLILIFLGRYVSNRARKSTGRMQI
ncbi:MAG: phosphate ABC transporter permease PstA [Acidimicrobiaceae bacterium]|nr:phosphate ABC transporter permease PstA [Acidimicrobiaceae bacterium]